MREGELDFNFSTAKNAEKLDEEGRKLPQGMKFVDFVLEEEEQSIMLEIKDPSCKARGGDPKAVLAKQRECDEFPKKLMTETNWPKIFPQYALTRSS